MIVGGILSLNLYATLHAGPACLSTSVFGWLPVPMPIDPKWMLILISQVLAQILEHAKIFITAMASVGLVNSATGGPRSHFQAASEALPTAVAKAEAHLS